MKRKRILTLVVIGIAMLFAGCSGVESKDDVDSSTITATSDNVGTNEMQDVLKISDEKLELYLGETKEVYLEVSDKSKLAGILHGQEVVETSWNIDNPNADDKVVITIHALDYGEATVDLTLGEVNKQIFISVKETDTVNGLFVRGTKLNEYTCFVRGNFGLFSSDKFDINIYYPEGFVMSEYDILGYHYVDFYLDNDSSKSVSDIYISYQMLTAGMGDIAVKDIVKEYQKDYDEEQIVYQDGNKAFVCESLDEERGSVLVGTLEQGTYYMAMTISFDKKYTNFCRAFAKEIYQQYNNNIVFAPPKTLVIPTREDVFVNDLVLAEGNIVHFGYYEQDNIIENGFEPIEWEVLEVQDNKALLISKYILDYEAYDVESATKNINWAESDLRIWLNDYFYDAAFVNAEKEIILETQITNASDFLETSFDDTIDRIFCLSIDEWLQYYSEKGEKPQTTKYAEADACEEPGCYWLRSLGFGTFYLDSSFSVHNCIADREGWWDGHEANTETGVRPAMWVEIVQE